MAKQVDMTDKELENLFNTIYKIKNNPMVPKQAKEAIHCMMVLLVGLYNRVEKLEQGADNGAKD